MVLCINNLAVGYFACRLENLLRIWTNAESVWKELPNCNIASGYIQAYRIAKKVIEEKGDNKFLGFGSIHTNVTTDFYKTDNGMARKDREKISAPGI